MTAPAYLQPAGVPLQLLDSHLVLQLIISIILIVYK